MVKLTIGTILGQPNGILDLKTGFDETLKNVASASEDLLRIFRKFMKIVLIMKATT